LGLAVMPDPRHLGQAVIKDLSVLGQARIESDSVTLGSDMVACLSTLGQAWIECGRQARPNPWVWYGCHHSYQTRLDPAGQLRTRVT